MIDLTTSMCGNKHLNSLNTDFKKIFAHVFVSVHATCTTFQFFDIWNTTCHNLYFLKEKKPESTIMMKAFAAASVFLHVAAETQNNEYLRHTQESIDAIGMRSLNRIYGGEPVASAAEYPFFLSLMDGDSRVCGATLIAPKIALTAAHCVSSEGK